MATKAQLLAQVQSESRGGVYKIDPIGSGTFTDDNGQTVNEYRVAYVSDTGDTGSVSKLVMTVINEGQQDEDAVFQQRPTKAAAILSAVEAYLDAIPEYARYENLRVNEIDLWATATVYKIIDATTASRIEVFIYRDGATTAHRELI